MQVLSESNVHVLSSFLSIAGTSKNASDAITALQKARSILENAGISFEDCILLNLKKDNTGDELSKAKIYISQLEKKLHHFQNDVVETDVKPVNGFYKFKDLLNLVVSKTGGVVHGWQTSLMEASRGTVHEIDLPMLQKWRQLEVVKNIGPVPEYYYDAVSNMEFSRLSAEKIHYTEEEKIAFNDAYDEYKANSKNSNYVIVADQLSEELDRRVTENSVKRIFDRIKLYHFVLFHIDEAKEAGLFDGKTEKELAAMFSTKIGRTVSSKLVKAALSGSDKQVW